MGLTGLISGSESGCVWCSPALGSLGSGQQESVMSMECGVLGLGPYRGLPVRTYPAGDT